MLLADAYPLLADLSALGEVAALAGLLDEAAFRALPRPGPPTRPHPRETTNPPRRAGSPACRRTPAATARDARTA